MSRGSTENQQPTTAKFRKLPKAQSNFRFRYQHWTLLLFWRHSHSPSFQCVPVFS